MSRSILILLLVLSLSMPACAAREFAATPISLADHVGPGEIYGSIRLLGALRLARAEFDGLRLCGLSGLAWDENAGLLQLLADHPAGLFRVVAHPRGGRSWLTLAAPARHVRQR